MSERATNARTFSWFTALLVLAPLAACQTSSDEEEGSANQAATADAPLVVTALQRTVIKTSTLESTKIVAAGQGATDTCTIAAGTKVTVARLKPVDRADVGHRRAALTRVQKEDGADLEAPCEVAAGQEELPVNLRLGSEAFFFEAHFSGWGGGGRVTQPQPVPGPGPAPAPGQQFGQVNIDPAKVIVVAPAKLTSGVQVFEQIGRARPCWATTGSSPAVVDYLLLKFDFTGICARALDSNGRGVRVAGADQSGRLTLRSEAGDVLLAWASPKGDVVVGRTHGAAPGQPLQVLLEPGWRMTHRTYGGKTLGYFYFTHDAPL
jgi:hypothetical protein